MDGSPAVLFRWRTTEAWVEADGVIGRGPLASLRVDDPRVSTIHAELSWRNGGPTLIARGGRLLRNGRPSREVLVSPGVEIALAPGVEVVAVEVRGAPVAPTPPTAGRERLTFEIGEHGVDILAGGERAARLVGVPGRLLALVLQDGAAPWDRLAEALWPEEGTLRRATAEGRSTEWCEVDERRLRNRFDQHLCTLRREVQSLRGGTMLEMVGGELSVRTLEHDHVVQSGVRTSRSPTENP